jgi:hypothetical protein
MGNLTCILLIGLRYLQMPLTQKSVSESCSASASCKFASISQYQISNNPSVCFFSIVGTSFVPAPLASADATYDISPAIYWLVIKSNVGILAASIPSSNSLAKRYLPRLIGNRSFKPGGAGLGTY